jgi:hypothetical protein
MSDNIVIAILLTCTIGGYALGSHNATTAAEAKAAKQATVTQQAFNAATLAAAAKERALNTSLLHTSAQLIQEQSNHAAQIDTLRRAVRAGTVRLSIPTTARNCAAPGASAAAPGQSGAEARAELVPATADDLIAIAFDGDSAVLQLNAVIDAYNAIRTACQTGAAGQ